MKTRRWVSAWVRPSATVLAGTLVAAAIPLCLGDVLPVNFRLEQVLTGTARPSGIAIAPDGRIFFGERTTGNVRIVKAGQLVPTPFVTIAVNTTGAGEGLIDVALHPSFAQNGWVYVFYTESGTRANRIVRYTDSNGLATSPLAILSLPASADGTRIGGSMAFGADGKLYVTTGDLATSSNAQNNASLAGKLLRLNDNGTIPSDNPVAGSSVYAKGFRSGGGLASNKTVGTLYQTDQGSSSAPTAQEECNAITEGNGATMKNYAWDAGSGKLNNPSYVDPLTASATINTCTAAVPYASTHYPASYRNDLYEMTQTNGHIEEIHLTGARLDTFSSTKTLYDPAADGDGTPDAGCPKKWAHAAVSGDGYLYMTAEDSASVNGIYRVLYDDSIGPREISPPGSTVPLAIKKVDATHIRLTWEDQKKDAFVGAPLASGQHNTKYTVWQGSLPIDTNGNGTPDWSHVALVATNGTTVNDLTLSEDVAIDTSSSRYYLISSQSANREGPLGFASDGTPIPGVGTQDWCGALGYGTTVNTCAAEFRTPGGAPLLLPDENGVLHSLSEYRSGGIVHLDMGAQDCFWCQVQAQNESQKMEDKYRGRGYKEVMVFDKNLATLTPFANQSECTTAINSWRATYAGTYTILCDLDTNGNGKGDIAEQYLCGGWPTNLYLDHNWVIYGIDCGFNVSAETQWIQSKVWPEWCE